MSRTRTFALLLLITTAAIAIQGYHPGLEDDAFYLAAIKRDLNPALFPHDADFFRLQFQATIFDKLIAASVRLTHLPLSLTIFLWQFAATFLILAACLAIARRSFPSPQAHWAAVLTVAVLLTIPVSGTAISLTDQYLHPRALATAALLGAIAATLDRRPLRAAFLLFAAALVHVIMAAFGVSLCIFLGWHIPRSFGELPASHHPRPSSAGSRHHLATALLLAAVPLPWLFEPTSEAWHQAASTRHFYFLSQWHWYEWLGVIAPFFILYYFTRLSRHSDLSRPSVAETTPTQTAATSKSAEENPASRKDSSAPRCLCGGGGFHHLSTRLLYYAIFQLAVALLIMLPPPLERLRPFEPMRFLQLVYLLMFLLAGGLIGQYILTKNVYRWLLLFIPLSAGMFYAQRQMYPSTAHLELPGFAPSSDWLRAFDWVRKNTPADALFALDPYYLELPGEDFHGFRALAERSALADMVKDPGMAARVPSLAPRWLRESSATRNWQNFQSSDFQNLKATFGINWVILANSPVAAQSTAAPTCPYQNPTVKVCRLRE